MTSEPSSPRAKNSRKSTGNFSAAFKEFGIFFISFFSIAIIRTEKEFAFGEHLAKWCFFLQCNPRTLIISARYHLKTTVALGFIAWHMWRALRGAGTQYTEWLFMAYKEDLAEYQLKRLNRYIAALPEIFGEFKRTSTAEGSISYSYNGRQFVCEPCGIMSFKRGRHPYGIIADDILKDPEAKLDISQLKKIEDIFMQEVESMPKGELHLSGTPQDDNDLFSTIERAGDYKTMRCPAVLDYTRESVLWPEKFSFAELMKIKKRILDRAFNKEYMCKAVRGEEGFFCQQDIDALTWPRLKQYDLIRPPRKLNDYAYAGLDIGKKRHPSHLAVLVPSRRRGKDHARKLIQVHSKWMDGWPYVDQVDYCREIIEKFKVGKLIYDATRAEFDGFSEIGTLPDVMQGMTFSAKTKYAMAGGFDKAVEEKQIRFLEDRRQRDQILNCDNDLKSMETPGGHGDAFWSMAMAIEAYNQGQAVFLTDLGAA